MEIVGIVQRNVMIIIALQIINQKKKRKKRSKILFQRNEILKLAIDIKSSKKSLDENSKKILKDKFLNPSHLLISSQILNKDELIKKEDYAACACSIQNLAISLASSGVQIKWSSGEIIRSKRIYNILNIDRTLEEIIGFIWVGYGKILPEIKRPLIKEIYKQI